MGKTGKRRPVLAALAALAVLALAGMALSAFMLSRWSDIRVVTAQEAELRLDQAAASAGAGVPYLQIGAGGRVGVHRELEGPAPAPAPIRTLHIRAFDPGRGQLYTLDFPWWFVRVKLNSTVNLGTLVSAMAGDWGHLDLKVTEDDLERRGPGLILDHRPAAGGRIVLWTE